MKWLILYILKGQHERLMDKYHDAQYHASKYTQSLIWERVVRCRNKIRRIEPDYLKGCD